LIYAHCEGNIQRWIVSSILYKKSFLFSEGKII
jgi:hypothetical protein